MHHQRDRFLDPLVRQQRINECYLIFQRIAIRAWQREALASTPVSGQIRSEAAKLVLEQRNQPAPFVRIIRVSVQEQQGWADTFIYQSHSYATWEINQTLLQVSILLD
jgi:hypothetical protein